MSEIQFAKDKADLKSILDRSKYLVLNFTASWCGPCQATKPIVDSSYNDPKNKKIEIVRVDLDQCQAIASDYGITSVPTFVFIESGKEVDRVTGFSGFQPALNKLRAKADIDSSVTGRGSGPSASPMDEAVKRMLPKGFTVINDAIHFGETVTLNAMPLSKENDEAKSVFKTASTDSTIYSDADSQMLFFTPLNHICKIYSVLIKLARPNFSPSSRLDEDELADECQPPALVKIWANKPGILSFDDTGISDALHEEKITVDADQDWYEIKLKYVRFQNVQNLNIFVEGCDEDYHTLIEKILIVGITGDSTEHTAILQDDE